MISCTSAVTALLEWMTCLLFWYILSGIAHQQMPYIMADCGVAKAHVDPNGGAVQTVYTPMFVPSPSAKVVHQPAGATWQGRNPQLYQCSSSHAC